MQCHVRKVVDHQQQAMIYVRGLTWECHMGVVVDNEC